MSYSLKPVLTLFALHCRRDVTLALSSAKPKRCIHTHTNEIFDDTLYGEAGNIDLKI